MFNLKKIATVVCSVAMIAATVVMPITSVSAAPAIEVGVRTGNSAPGTSGIGANKKYNTSIVVTMGGIFNSDTDFSMTSAGELDFLVTKDVFTGAVVTSLGDNGMIGAVNGEGISWQPDVQAYNDEYDIIKLLYYGTDAYTTMTGDVVEVKLTYAAKADFPGAVIIPATSSYMQFCDDTLANTDLVRGTDFVNVDKYQYTLSAGTATVGSNVIVKSEIGPSVVEATVSTDPTFVGAYQGDSDGTPLANSNAIAYKAGITPGTETVSNATWTVTVGANHQDLTQNFGTALTGDGEVLVGLIVNGLSEAANSVALTLGE